MATSIYTGSASPGAAATGRPQQGHVQYAVNQGAWWVFYLTSTNQLSAQYSSDGTTWSTPTGSPFTLAAAHGSFGYNFGFAYANISSTDILHMAAVSIISNTATHRHSRFTLGTTWSNTNAEATVGTPSSAAGGQYPVGPVTILDSSNTPVDSSWAIDVGGAGGSSAPAIATHTDSGTSWTAGYGTPHDFSSVSALSESNFLASLGSQNLLLVNDNGSGSAVFTNLFAYKYTGSWGSNTTPLAGNVTSTNDNNWGATALSTSAISVVALSNNSNTYVCRTFNGSSWSTFTAPANLAYGTTSGIACVNDGTNIYIFVADASKNIQYNKSTGTTWAGWTVLEATRTNAPTYLTACYSAAKSAILVAWTEHNGSNYEVWSSLLSLSTSNNYSLAASPGSFAESGVASGLSAARHLTASSGSFAETGQAATLRKGYNLAAAVGSFTESGQTAGLKSARSLIAAAGSFTESGQTAGLKAARSLIAAAGAFVESGQTAGLKAARSLIAAAGSFAETGQASTLRKGRNLAAAAGSFAETGQTATLIKGYNLAVSAGSFAETGQTATLRKGRNLTAVAGAFSLTGQAAAMKSARSLLAAAGSFAETGQTATLTWSHAGAKTLVTSPGSFAFTGVAAGLASARHLIAIAGAFAETGQTAGLKAARSLVTAKGTFTEAGQASTMARGRTLAAAAGSFTETGQTASFHATLTLVAGAGSYALAGHPATLTTTTLVTAATIAEATYKRLVGLGDLAALGVIGIYPYYAPESAGSVGPWIEYEVDDSANEIDLDGDHPTGEATLTLRAVCASLRTSELIVESLRANLPTIGASWSGLIVDAALIDDESDDYVQNPDGSDTGLFQITQTYTLLYKVPST